MTAGTSTYMGLAVPLYGECDIKAQSTTLDVLSISGASSGTGDYIVAKSYAGTEAFVVQDGGNIVMTQTAAADIGLKMVQYSTPTADAITVYANDAATIRWAITKNHGMLLRYRTTKPSTGLTKGEMLLMFHNSTPRLAVCTSTAGDTLKMIRLRTKTLGRLTA
jgi:hypothetical protein